MRSILLGILIFFFSGGGTLGATASLRTDSLEFAGLSAALGTIFSAEKIQSILSKLPPNCKIYGYDIGDFSGDDGMDVALSTMPQKDRGRDVSVHFFINRGPSFELVRTLQRRFIIEPIEVGFSIDRGVAHVTEKTGEYGWRITGYAVIDGVFRRVTEWTTDRMPFRGNATAVGYERGHDLRTNLVDEHFFGTNTNRSFLRQKFYLLPVFAVTDEVPEDVSRSIGDSTALMIVQGGSSWHGPEDCSLLCSAEYDSATVTFRLTVRDDRLLYTGALDSSDYAALSFDFSRKSRVRPGGAPQHWSPNTALDVILIMGDGERRGTVVELRGKELSQRHANEIAVTMQQDTGAFHVFHFTVRMPRELFAQDDRLPSAGFVCSYHDVDYPANLSWVSLAATSRGYVPGAPETYGRLHFIRDARERYEWENLRTRDMAIELRRAGILP